MAFNNERYEVIKLYDKETLEHFYDGYMHNINLNLFPSAYLHPGDIALKPNHNRTWDKISRKDGFIHQYQHEKLGLAKDILDRGNYFPIWCYKEAGRCVVAEGVHRMESIHLAIEAGLWKDEKLFVIFVDKEYDIAYKKFDISMMAAAIEVFYPVHNLEDGWFLRTFGKRLCRFDNWQRYGQMKQDGNLKITIDSYDEFFNASKVYHKFLRHAFYKYHQATGDQIKPRFDLK